MSTDEFTDGCERSASTAALAKKGRNDSLTPSRGAKSFFTWSRSLAIRVTSASTTVVSCALISSDSTIRLAMTVRSRDIFSVRPRRAESGVAAGDGVRAPARGRARRRGGGGGACPRRRGGRGGGGLLALLRGGDDVLLADPPADA